MHRDLLTFALVKLLAFAPLFNAPKKHVLCLKWMQFVARSSVSHRILWDLWWQVTSHINLHIHDVIASSLHSDEFWHLRSVLNVTYCNTNECPIKLFTLYFLLSYIKQV